MKTAPFILTALTLLGSACVVEPTPDAAEPMPPEFVRGGLRYVPIRKNLPEQFSPSSHAAAQPAQPRLPPADLATASDEALVAQLSGLTLHDGWIYQVTPEPELIREVRAHAGTMQVTPSPAGASVDEAASFELGHYILGGDDRQVRGNNTDYPWSTIVFMLTPDDTGVCTGTMIGPSTLLTAAHCFWDGQNFREFDFFPGMDITDDNPTPFGMYSCYGVVIGGWSIPQEDYAVVDFRSAQYGCNDRPGDTTGWMGVRVYSDSQLRDTTAHLYGYPSDKLPFPRIWGTSGRVTRLGADHIVYDMDETAGQSGGAIFMYEGSWPNVVGLNSGGTWDFNMQANQGARITAAVHSNIVAWSTDY